MGLAVGVLVGAVVIVLALRQWMLHRECPQRHAEPFEGVVYRVGKAAIAERRCDNPRATVICMHGFIEDLRYFTTHYSAPDLQLILLTSCDYHVPISGPEYRSASWVKVPAAPEGSIPYDAAVLLQALEHLPRGGNIRVHGHSRGGAVTLEAAAMRPDLFKDVEVVLEAPVLPRARVYKAMSAVELWLLAFFMPLWRREPISPRNKGAFGPLEDARKRELIMGLPFNAKRAATMVANLHGMESWMKERDHSLYQHVRRGIIVVPGKDKVLDARSMLESARHAEPRLQVVQLEGCSHFPLFDRPGAFPALEPARPLSASAS